MRPDAATAGERQPTAAPPSPARPCACAGLAEALNRPEERGEAAAAIRELIERIVFTPGPKWAEIDATLVGDLGAILEWTGTGGPNGKTDTPGSGMSVSGVAGARNHRDRHLIEIPV